MPRIDAPTVAEHSAQRRAAIVDAAVDLLGREGIAGVTPAAVASAAGLARSSVYQYFSSTDALVAAGVEEAFRRTRVLVDRGQARATTPAERVAAWVDSALDAAVAGHEPMSAYAAADLPDACRAAVAELHHGLAAPLVAALEEHGVSSPGPVAELVAGVVVAAAAQVARGQAVRTVRRRTRAFVLAAIHL
ncbi:MAG: TetR/AcrR family transcriptional regulator [Actinobacteria bacterium]|nr:TetR/AcrR family transcriptional regulator [Actinomycetota bacterium]